VAAVAVEVEAVEEAAVAAQEQAQDLAPANSR
jgi:hypothetical protein